ncbi:MAG: cupredoxin domain-containing protein [Nitrososphaerales archaeon]
MVNKHPIFWEILTLGTLIIALSFILLPMLDAVLLPREPREIVVRLSIHESGGFDPDEIRVKKGEPVKLIFIGMDVSHGFAIELLGIDAGVIHPGKEVVFEFTPEKEGVYMFKCTINCSPYHHFMRGKLIVEE